jgi:protein-tyrosine phosphatase
MPTHQIADGLWVGPAYESIATVMIPGAPYKTIINVLEQPVVNFMVEGQLNQFGARVIDFRIRDDDGMVSKTRLDELVHVIDASRPCAVCCAAGVERSPLAVAWYISRRTTLTLEKAYEEVCARHPETQIRTQWLK